ncbi:unnamed protein product [Brachionus calyciflorus]|uniref:Peptidase C1A papain C-terminal domain-containing protein n=1 Tax=Brachionus calyciflorus TaxID=104777 RepID=A0A813TGW1_9BILA|nr:unnamed protein product [Brachionus calyciflorus]
MAKFQFILDFIFIFFIKSLGAIQTSKDDPSQISKPINRMLNQDWKIFKNFVHVETEDSAKDLTWRRKFEESYELISRHNIEFQLNPEKVKYRLKLTEYAHMTDEEFMKKKTGLKINRKSRKKTIKEKRAISDPKRPKTYDSRTKYPIPPRDQGDCGGCYAFSAVASIEFQLAKKNKITSLSEQNLIDCSGGFGNFGCNGGIMDAAFEYMISNKGINSLLFYPYVAKQESCKFKSNYIGAKLKGYGYANTEEELEDAIYKYGAVSCGIDASLPTFRLYADGIYNDTKCSKTDINHAINVVGYTENTFICRNSWGTAWGMGGYFELPKGENTCGLISYCVYPIL